METDTKGVYVYYSADEETNKFENEWYQKNGEKQGHTLEMIAHGFSYYSKEIEDYAGSGKDKIDKALKELGVSTPIDTETSK